MKKIEKLKIGDKVAYTDDIHPLIYLTVRSTKGQYINAGGLLFDKNNGYCISRPRILNTSNLAELYEDKKEIYDLIRKITTYSYFHNMSKEKIRMIYDLIRMK